MEMRGETPPTQSAEEIENLFTSDELLFSYLYHENNTILH